jgi:hypothetical protein
MMHGCFQEMHQKQPEQKKSLEIGPNKKIKETKTNQTGPSRTYAD